MKGPLPSIQVHCKLDSVGGCQDGLFEMGGMLTSKGLAFVLLVRHQCNWGVDRSWGYREWFQGHILRGLEVLICDIKIEDVNSCLHDGSRTCLYWVGW